MGEIPLTTQVLIAHDPAYHTLDYANSTYNKDRHVGSTSLQKRKLELPNLTHHISGHIHEAYSVTIQGNLTNICASILNDRYELVNTPIEFNINEYK